MAVRETTKQSDSKAQKPKHSPSQRKKRIIWGITFGLISALLVLLILRWNAWFGNKPEAPYRTEAIIDRITLTPGENFVSERNIAWRCGEVLEASSVEFGLAGVDTTIIERQIIPAQGQSIKTRSGQGCFYAVRLTGLEEGATYRYKVRTGGQVSEAYTFTIPYSQESSEFLYIGDVQDPDGKLSDSLMPQLQEVLPRLDFLAAAGDQIEGPANQYWDIWYKSLGAWSPELTMIASTGNHEYLKRGIFRELDPRWTAQYIYPDNGPKGFKGRSYYIDFPLMRYIVMDSNGITAPWDILRHRAWLREVLNSSVQPWQVVMFHHAIHSVREGRSNPIMHYGFKSILEENGADLVLQGHDHAYARSSSKHPTEGYATAPVYIISSSSPKTYRNGFDEIHDRLGSGLQLYQHISVYPQRLHYRSYKYDGALYDDIELQQGIVPSAEPIKVIDNAQGIKEEFRFDAFGNSSKGLKKAEKYRQSVEEYLKRKGYKQ